LLAFSGEIRKLSSSFHNNSFSADNAVLLEGVSAQSSGPGLEFLVVCTDSAVFPILAAAIHEVGGRLNCAPTCAKAADYVARRKIDGIILDAAVPGAREFMNLVRRGSSNKFSVLFACLDPDQHAAPILQAGANIVLQKPLEPGEVFQAIAGAVSLMSAEKRRFFRYPLSVPVALTVAGMQKQVTMSNLSEGGMAVWSVREHPAGSQVEFSFRLPFGGVIRGQGEIAWINNDGNAGIRFHILPDRAYTHLYGWLSRRDPQSNRESAKL
jgi:CheY-like chemotaxis protein